MPDNPRIEELRRRVQKDPASIAFAQLAEEYRRAGEYEESARVCRSGLERHPTYLSARVTLGRALIELQQYDDARAELDHVLRSAPENLTAIRGLAEIHQRQGNLTEALRQYRTALVIAKHDPELEETVSDLTRQVDGARVVDSKASVPPGPDPSAANDPPPVPAVASPSEPRTIPLSSLSPELEAAADEFTKALQALDALSLDLPAESAPPGDGAAIDREEAAPAATAAPPTGEEAVVEELESWLDAIIAERDSRTAKL